MPSDIETLRSEIHRLRAALLKYACRCGPTDPDPGAHREDCAYRCVVEGSSVETFTQGTLAPDEYRVMNLAMCVRRLARLLRKHEPDSEAAAQALDYLERQGLQGSPLRDADETEQKPVEPSPGLLMSMALRYDHALGCPGYYDQMPFRSPDDPSHQQRLDAALTLMRQLWEEVAGHGFYRPEKEAEYAARVTVETSGDKP